MFVMRIGRGFGINSASRPGAVGRGPMALGCWAEMPVVMNSMSSPSSPITPRAPYLASVIWAARSTIRWSTTGSESSDASVRPASSRTSLRSSGPAIAGESTSVLAGRARSPLQQRAFGPMDKGAGVEGWSDGHQDAFRENPSHERSVCTGGRASGRVISLRRRRTVADVMTSKVDVACPLMPFKRLVQLIEENRISAITIVDEQGVPVGIVSESDLLMKERRQEFESELNLLHPRRRRDQMAKATGVVASEIMSTPPITVRSDTTLPVAARLMQERNVRRLVVVDERGKISCIVSRSDLLQVFLRTDQELRAEVEPTVIPSMLMPAPEPVRGLVHWNVVTLVGEGDRKTDVDILSRMTRDVDGVVDVVNRLRYSWDDTSPSPAGGTKRL